MDPLSVAASVIATATLTLQSSKAVYDFVNGLAEAPLAIAKSKASLKETEKTLNALNKVLRSGSAPPSTSEAVLQTIKLGETFQSVQSLCDKFDTSRSSPGRFSKRDRLSVVLPESMMEKLNEELEDCQRNMSMVLVSIDLCACSIAVVIGICLLNTKIG